MAAVSQLVGAPTIASSHETHHVQTHLIPSIRVSNPAERLVLRGQAPIVLLPTRMTKSAITIVSTEQITLKTTLNNAPEPPKQQLSSVARRKRFAHRAPAPSAHASNASTEHKPKATSYTELFGGQLAPVGVVDTNLLSKQPSTIHKPIAVKTPPVTKETTPELASTPTPVQVPIVKARPSKATARATTGPAGGSAKPSPPDTSSSSTKPELKKISTKHNFLFIPESLQPDRGPYTHFSPMYHYYHPYRNIHRETIKAEYDKLHPVVEKPPPPEPVEPVTPPKRASTRQKKVAGNGNSGPRGKRGEKLKGKGKNASMETDLPNGATPSPPAGDDSVPAATAPLTARRAPRASVAKTKAPAGPGRGKGKGRASAALAALGTPSAVGTPTKRKRGDLEDDGLANAEKGTENGTGAEDVTPPAPKRPRRKAAALRDSMHDGSKDETPDASLIDENGEGGSGGGPGGRLIKRRMRPNARKTAAARAAAMVAKKKKRSAEEGEGEELEGDPEDVDEEADPTPSVKADDTPETPSIKDSEGATEKAEGEHQTGSVDPDQSQTPIENEGDLAATPPPVVPTPTRGRGRGRGGATRGGRGASRGGGRGRGGKSKRGKAPQIVHSEPTPNEAWSQPDADIPEPEPTAYPPTIPDEEVEPVPQASPTPPAEETPVVEDVPVPILDNEGDVQMQVDNDDATKELPVQ